MSKEKIIFICHGSICRSPMAHYIFLDEINKRNLKEKYDVSSYAVSYEEEGNDIDYRAKKQLDKNNVPYSFHPATHISLDEYRKAKSIYTMDNSNIYILKRIFPNEDHSKIHLLNEPYEISDPWYTHDFDLAFKQIKKSIIRLIEENKL